MRKPAHILVIRFSSLGDAAMCVPVLRRVAKQYPDLKITLLTKPFYAPVFKGIPNVSVVGADVKNTYKGFFGLWKLANELKSLKIDAVADLHNVLRSKILRLFFFLFGIKSAKINKGRKEKKALTRPENKKFLPLKTTHQRYAEVFKKLGFPVDLSQKTTIQKPSLSEKVQELIGKSTQKWIGIAPFAKYQTKIYPMDLMERTLAELDRENSYKLLIFGGGKQEKLFAESLETKHQNTLSLIGKLTFTDELNLIANLDAMLSMDSGNGHLAAMYDVPVITLWGATHPFAGFAPFGQPKENQFTPDLKKYPQLPTSVYGNKIIPGYEDVMRTISPQSVAKKIKDVL